jgi:hypothetical protein
MPHPSEQLSEHARRLDNLTARLVHIEWMIRGELGEDFDATEHWRARAEDECERAAAAEVVLYDVLCFLASHLCTCRRSETPPPAPSDHVTTCFYQTQCKRLGVPFDFGAGAGGVRVRVS